MALWNLVVTMLLLVLIIRTPPDVFLSSEVGTWCIYEDCEWKGKQKTKVAVTI